MDLGASPFAEAGSVDRTSVFQDRTCRRRAVAEVVRGSGAVYLLHPQIVAVVRKGVGHRARVGNALHPVLIVVRNRRNARAHRNGRAFAVVVVSVAFAARSQQLVMRTIGVVGRRTGLGFGETVGFVVIRVAKGL